MEEQFERRIGKDLDIIFCSLSLDKDSILQGKEGRRRLANAGIKSTSDVADWIVELLRNQKQPKAAESLQNYFEKRMHPPGTLR